MDDRVLEIVLRARDEASKTLKAAGREVDSFGKRTKDVLEKSVIPLDAGFAATTGFLVSSVQAFNESEEAAAQLNAVLKSTKGVDLIGGAEGEVAGGGGGVRAVWRGTGAGTGAAAGAATGTAGAAWTPAGRAAGGPWPAGRPSAVFVPVGESRDAEVAWRSRLDHVATARCRV